MRVLVTGVTGFLGGRVAEGLAAAGHVVRGFVRNPEGWTWRPPGAEESRGDVTDAASFRRAAAGCEAVVHCAALVKVWARERQEFDRTNLEGLKNAADAAREAGARLIYTSSFIALGPTDGRVFEEDTPRLVQHFHNDYERTKWLADQLARHLAKEGFPIVRLYPGVVYGPGALSAGNHVVELLLKHARGKLPGLLGRGDRRMCLAYVKDVVSGFIAALERAPDGSGYILGGENRTTRELFETFARASGIAPPRRKIPFWLAAAVGKVGRWRAELTGSEPEMTDEVVGIYTHDWAYSSSRAQKDLGYRITSFEQGIRETTGWLREIGELPGGKRR